MTGGGGALRCAAIAGGVDMDGVEARGHPLNSSGNGFTPIRAILLFIGKSSLVKVGSSQPLH